MFFYVIMAVFATYPVETAYSVAQGNAYRSSHNLPDSLPNRFRRDITQECNDEQWRCEDGSCIPLDEKCDGVAHCLDGSDETHALCRARRCAKNLFRCTYGACVDGTAPCNGINECVDGSDELVSRCGAQPLQVGDKFQCANGATIPSSELCDGVRNCTDGSDETLESCGWRRCAPYLFQCDYGACVDLDKACDAYGRHHCVNGSDEGIKLCSTININRPSKVCVLPDHPKHGSYSLSNGSPASPGQMHKSVTLMVTCQGGYCMDGITNTDYPSCLQGFWYHKMPECRKFCRIPRHRSVEFTCITKDDIYESERKCRDYEPSGTQVNPKCRPGYYQSVLSIMQCNDDGTWDNIVTCIKGEDTCGVPQNKAEPLIMNGVTSKLGEMPWHAAIYNKRLLDTPVQICGGSLATRRLVISAAHCFWNDVEHQLNHTHYSVGLGLVQRQWNDSHGQRFNVASLQLPEQFSGVSSNYQADIALVFLDKDAVFDSFVQPVCINLDDRGSDEEQLTAGRLGKVAGWGLTQADGNPSEELNTKELPVVDYISCKDNSPFNFEKYITTDKFCAGNVTGTALCKGDSGGGLVFRGPDDRYYLRGVVSTRARDSHTCNAIGYTTFTRVYHYAIFVKKYIK